METAIRTGSISCSFSISKSQTRVELLTTARRVVTKSTKIPLPLKLSRVCHLVKYCSLAALILLAGDVSPNPDGINQFLTNLD